MFGNKFKFTYDEIKIIVMALVELKNRLIEEDRYTDCVDDLLIRHVLIHLKPMGFDMLCTIPCRVFYYRYYGERKRNGR